MSADPVPFVPALALADEVVDDIADGAELDADEQLALLAALRRVQAEELDPAACQRVLVETAVEVLHAHVGWLSLVEPGADGFTVVHKVGVGEALDLRRQSVSGFGAEAARRQATLIVNDFVRSARTPPTSRALLIAAGLRALMVTPLIAGELIGLLCIGRRSAVRFERRDSAVAGALAAQGAMTVRNGRLFAEVAQRTARLEASVSVGTEVHERLVRGDGLAGAAAALAEALGCPVAIEQDVVAEEPGWWDTDGRLVAPPGETQTAAELVADGERLGAVLVAHRAALSELQLEAVAVTSTAIVSELLARRRAEEHEWRLHGELLAELVSAPHPLPRPLAIRAVRSGMDLRVPAVVATVAVGTRDRHATPVLQEARAALRRGLPPGAPVLAFERDDSIVLALSGPGGDDGVLTAVLDALVSAGRVRAGVGRSTRFDQALLQADACLVLAADPHRADVVDVAALGLIGAVLEERAGAVAAATVRRELGPVVAAERHVRVPLLTTLEAFCATEGRVEAAARRARVHESTMRYRLARLEEVIDLTGGPPRLIELRTALEALAVLRAVDQSPFGSGG